MARQKISLTFSGGAERVTGANFLLETETAGRPWRILIDCGLIQGLHEEEKINWEPFPYQPATIDAVLVTHAHLDHIGRLPKLVKDGFHGQIYSTPPTKDISELSFHDSVGLLAREAERSHQTELYDSGDIAKTVSLWRTINYREPFALGPLIINFRDAGHILGSAMIEISFGGRKILFTGDLGNSPSPLLPDTEVVNDADYLIIESVYGDRNHEDRSRRREQLEDVIEETMRAGGTLMIPAFSIERTQELLFEIERMVEGSRIPIIPVFVDSPLGIKVTAVYQKYQDYLKTEVAAEAKNGDGIFRFPNLHLTLSTEASKAIITANPRKVIIAGSGMSTGGRILHHEKIYLSDPKSTLLLIGYQGVGTLGRLIQDGARTVRILGEEIPILARVVKISGFSGHKDSTHLLDFVHQTADHLKQVLVVMGEPKASLFLVQRIRDYLGLSARAPKNSERVELDWEV